MADRHAFVDGVERLSRWGVPEVLETMFFATAVPSAGSRCADGSLGVAIEFRGTPSGVFTMRLDAADARALGAAFLGREPGELDPDEDRMLACELANILCGSVLSRAAAGGTFELGAPEIKEAREPSEVQAGFLLDTGGALEIGFRLDAEERP